MNPKNFIVCGNGLNINDSSAFRQSVYGVVDTAFIGKCDEIYVKDDAILYIAGGNIFKDGNFNFEKAEEDPLEKQKRRDLKIKIPTKFYKPKKLEFKSLTGRMAQESVVECVFGDNHILLRTVKGTVYSFGDNYHGQLGIGNTFVAKIYFPHEVPLKNVTQIFAYKNNSFALDLNNKLWVWGSGEFLGNGFKGNSFKPINIMSLYNISKIKFIDGRIMLVGIPETVEDEKKLEPIGDEGKTEKKEEKPPEAAKEEAKPVEAPKEEAKPAEEAKPEANEDGKDGDSLGSAIQSFLIKIDSDISTCIGKFTLKDLQNNKNSIVSESPEFLKLRDIRNKILMDERSIKIRGLEVVWDEVLNIIEKRGDFTVNSKLAKSKETIDIFMMIYTSMIAGHFDENNITKYLLNYSNNEKEMKKMIAELSKSDPSNLSVLTTHIENVKILLEYFLRYKKLEMLIHKMAGHQFLLKSYQFTNVLDALKYVFDQHDDVEKKLYIIEKTFGNLRHLVDKVSSSFEGLGTVFEGLGKANSVENEQNADKFSVESEKNVEKFLHKHIIESTLYIKDLWLLLIQNVETNIKAKEKEEQLLKVLDKYNELYSIQRYLNNVNVSKLLDVNSRSPNDLKTEVIKIITEVDGIITRLELFLKNICDQQIDHFSKEMIVMYATNMLDNAYHRKIIFHLLYGIEKRKKRDQAEKI